LGMGPPCPPPPPPDASAAIASAPPPRPTCAAAAAAQLAQRRAAFVPPGDGSSACLGFSPPSPPPKTKIAALTITLALAMPVVYGQAMTRPADGLLLGCSKCKKMLPRGRFQRRSGRAQDGSVVWKSWCRECEAPFRAARSHRRQDRMVGRGSFTARDIVNLYQVQRGLCVLCGVDLRLTRYHVDHIRPIAKGGRNTKENLQLLCPRCNLRKGAR
jgi:5-methylcytosine-specific restriction endonuclease McrA